MSGNAQFGGALVLIGVIGRGLLQAVQTKNGRTQERKKKQFRKMVR